MTPPALAVFTTTWMFLETLSDAELMDLNHCLSRGDDPRESLAWPKVHALFGDVGEKGYPAMHALTWKAFQRTLSARVTDNP